MPLAAAACRVEGEEAVGARGGGAGGVHGRSWPINIDNLDPELKSFEIANSLVNDAKLDTVMTNSFGFGGTNGSMLLSNYDD